MQVQNPLPSPQPATPSLTYDGREAADPRFHDGRLRLAVGVQHYQALRCNRTNSGECDWFGWTYMHQPYLAYWNGRFHLSLISGPHSEPLPPQHALMLTSADGINWTRPIVLFPTYYTADDKAQNMHHRMGWYCAPSGRLLGLGFYGSNDGNGIGRVVREVYRNGSLGPIFFIRLNAGAGWTVANVRFPLFSTSDDAGFVEACHALLADRLMTAQWYEDEKDRTRDGFHALSGVDPGQAKAISWFHRDDGTVVAIAKYAWAFTSSDEGKTWTPPVQCPTLVMSGQKAWGQRTSDGRYALVYNPTTDNTHRWPLAIVTGEDGRRFSDLLCIQGEVPPRRFVGTFKDYGPQYVRGIEEGNGRPPGTDLWLTYSMNKEDIWVARVPVPLRGTVDDPVHDTFDGMTPGGVVTDWNIYSPRWAPVRVVEFPHPWDKSVELRDEDRGDYAHAVRVFREGRQVQLSLKVFARQTAAGALHIEVQDRYGNRPVRLILEAGGLLIIQDGQALREIGIYAADTWHRMELRIDVEAARFDVAWDGSTATGVAFAPPELDGEAIHSVERLSLRTGAYRHAGPPDTSTPVNLTSRREALHDLLECDRKQDLVVYNVDDVRITSSPRAADQRGTP